MVTLTVAGGKPVKTELSDDSVRSPAPCAARLRKWRFEMPRDGSSPMKVEAVFECTHGRLEENSVSLGLFLR
jgi:hypothetical protein